jgi:hypothetical protein
MLHRAKALNESRPPARLSQTGKALGFTVFTESTAFAHRVKTLEVKATSVLVRTLSASYKEVVNPKSEARNPKQNLMTEIQMSKTVKPRILA